ncbi:hypothetical protein K458DRAFT_429526 [Lentithecium fluviatile CBS 122367]|uniref:Uncharacterized protein n=1 Tax=Lentithecium fluviatile CBS 122367 TaxID=1168545 RepID=A0A6G1J8N7_9PLEO|nr:hypothetical protein K458DRAFT_429526 [Lentithecium fluviatile CBS 122367]
MVRPDIFDEVEDEWVTGRFKSGARHVHAPHRKSRDDGFGHRTTEFLVPENISWSGGLHRTKSQGHAPTPNVTIYNTTRLDNESNPNVRTEQKTPQPSPLMNPTRGRTRRIADEWALEDEIAELRLEVQKQRSRSRSDVHHHHREHSPQHAYDRWQLDEANRRLKEAEERNDQERREELIRRKIELKYMKDRQEREEEEERIKLEEDRLKKEWELKHEREERKRIEKEKDDEEKRKRIIADETAKHEREERQRQQRAKEQEEERKRIILENTAKIEKQEREAKEARQRAVDQFNKEQAEKERKAKEERERIVADYEVKKVRDAAQAKKQREELVMQLKIEEEQRKQKEKEEWERFLMKQKQKEQEEKEKKEKEEKRLEEEMRKRLAHFGFQDNQIQAMIKPEDAPKLQQGMAPHNPLRLGHQPTYVKVHKEHLAVDTLLYYDIPYEIDRSNPDYIIIMREMEPRETEILFEHTRRLRSRGSSRLLIEERHDHGGKNEYAWVRRRKPSRSPSRRRSSPKRVVGIKEMFY